MNLPSRGFSLPGQAQAQKTRIRQAGRILVRNSPRRKGNLRKETAGTGLSASP